MIEELVAQLSGKFNKFTESKEKLKNKFSIPDSVSFNAYAEYITNLSTEASTLKFYKCTGIENDKWSGYELVEDGLPFYKYSTVETQGLVNITEATIEVGSIYTHDAGFKVISL